jgi:hypothetical protein
LLDLRCWENCLQATSEVDDLYAVAADMGGMGFISAHLESLICQSLYRRGPRIAAPMCGAISRPNRARGCGIWNMGRRADLPGPGWGELT